MPANAFAWQVKGSSFKITNSLNAVESVQLYYGLKIDVLHSQNPDGITIVRETYQSLQTTLQMLRLASAGKWIDTLLRSGSR
jgi:hypothetical protein